MTIGVNLFYDYNQMGPGKVIKNLIKGLDEIGVPHASNDYSDETKNYYCGVLQGISGLHDKKLSHALLGPNLFILPIDWGDNIKKYKHYVVPSQWVLDKYRKFHAMEHATIDVWPVGIDTEYWKKRSIPDCNRALIYFKGRRGAELVDIVNKLHKLKIEYDIVEYGYYTEEELIKLLPKLQKKVEQAQNGELVI